MATICYYTKHQSSRNIHTLIGCMSP